MNHTPFRIPSLRGRALARRALVCVTGALLLCPLSACARAGRPAPVPAPAEEEPAVREAVDTRRLVRLGVVLPQGGPAYLEQFAAGVLEGVQVAVAEQGGHPEYRIEYVVREAGAAGAAAAVRALGEAGAVAVIAPLPDEQLASAAQARSGVTPAIINPIGARPLAGLGQVYALNVPDTLGAAALGEWAGRNRLIPAGVLSARDPASRAQARAFSAAYRAVTGATPLEVTYDPGTTTFGPVLRRLRDARVRALFVAADERGVSQILPQVDYYGMESVQVLATGAWASPDGVERIGRSTLEGALITLPFLPEDSTGGWQRFVRSYEEHFRRRLPSPIPALGYDAAQLVLANLARAGTAAGVANGLAAGNEVAGATGRLLAVSGSVLRRPVIVRVRAGRLIPVTVER